MGQLIGNLLNVVLDPIMILVFDWGVAGAAVATVIGNLFGAVYYILYFLRGNSVLSIHPKDFAVKDKICSGVLAIGIPASLGSLLMSVSQIVVNSQLVNYGDMAVAGMGVAMKVTMITAMLCIGMGQGVQPLLGYCVGAGVPWYHRAGLGTAGSGSAVPSVGGGFVCVHNQENGIKNKSHGCRPLIE